MQSSGTWQADGHRIHTPGLKLQTKRPSAGAYRRVWVSFRVLVILWAGWFVQKTCTTDPSLWDSQCPRTTRIRCGQVPSSFPAALLWSTAPTGLLVGNLCTCGCGGLGPYIIRSEAGLLAEDWSWWQLQWAALLSPSGLQSIWTSLIYGS